MTMSNTRRITTIAILSAISTVLMEFPRFAILPAANFLQIDFSILPILIGLFMLGRLRDGYTILILRSILSAIVFNQGVNTWIGMPMNIIAVGLFMTIVWIFLKKEFTLTKFIMSGVVGTLVFTVAMVILNLVYAVPLYERFAHWPAEMLSMNAYIIPIVIPFNLIEGVLFIVSFAVVYWALRGSKVIKFANA